MLHRLRNDFRLSIITLLGVCAVFGIVPFAVYRFVTGDSLVGVIDTAVVLFIVAMSIYAWRTGDTVRPGLLLVLVNTLGAGFASGLLGERGLFWFYPVFLSNFLLVGPRVALAANLLGVAIVIVQGSAFTSVGQMISFGVTGAVASAFAFIFSYRSEVQRQQLETLATIDPLTGAGNRRMLEQELQIAEDSATRDGSRYGLVMLDLDHFKQINDRDGHDAGDQVLVALSDLIRSSTRRVDRLFRYGGEEFVLLLPGVDSAGLRIAAENLRRRIESQLSSSSGPVTASMGVALLAAGEPWESWLQRADAALYRAKQAGRNRVLAAATQTPAQPADVF
jgi:diguanylate cyclase (GGDEF)-like protein